ncbi:MAG: YdeI/OmpD-associated family protein [Ignavibacteriales bacterium]|nr:YdeI/OmpD-associated family protein [Ignavibacteriales bacterium]
MSKNLRMGSINAYFFNAKIIKLGINPCVNVSAAVVKKLLQDAEKQNSPIQVNASVNNVSFEANVVKYLGTWRLYLNTQVRKDAKADMGNPVRISVAFDSKPRMPETPDALRTAFNKNNLAKDAWRMQPRSRRKEILLYLNSLKLNNRLSAILKKSYSPF